MKLSDFTEEQIEAEVEFINGARVHDLRGLGIAFSLIVEYSDSRHSPVLDDLASLADDIAARGL